MSGDHYIEQLETHCRRLQADNDELRAQVQAVRQVLLPGDESCDCGKCPVLVDARDILHALDGGAV